MHNVTEAVECPYTYATGQRCGGHVISVETPDVGAVWRRTVDGWRLKFGLLRAGGYFLVCSHKGNHGGIGRPGVERLQCTFDGLPEPLRAAVAETFFGVER